MMVGLLGAMTPKLGEWLQENPGATAELSLFGRVLRYSQNPQTCRLLEEDLRLRKIYTTKIYKHFKTIFCPDFLYARFIML